MKLRLLNKSLLGLLFVASLLSLAFALPASKGITLKTNGLYIAKTKTIEIADQTIEIYNYLRFYEDQTVITQAVSSFSPEDVGKWFHRDGKFERIGKYLLKKDELAFEVANKGLEDAKLEGERTDSFEGKILENGDLELAITYPSGEVINATFEFVELKSPN